MIRKLVLIIAAAFLVLTASSCAGTDNVGLIVLDPGHYHAALVQRTMYEQIDPIVHVYAPAGPEVQEYLARIEGFNTRAEDPTTWLEAVYTGPDYLERMQTDKAGNVVVLSGNNRRKAEYIRTAIDAGLNVFSDKPMCIDAAGFAMLEEAFTAAGKHRLVLYDIMTERYNRICMLQKQLMLDEAVFGALEKGSPANPAIVKESVHHFFKYISGRPIRRPTWYFDTAQQGEGLVDVTTHLIDQVLWTSFSEQPIDYRHDVTVLAAGHWPTAITKAQYAKVTGAADFPDYLRSQLNAAGVLPYYCNGEMIYTIKGICTKVAVTWNFEAPQGTGDTHYSLARGSRAHVIIRQGAEQGYRPQLYVEPAPTGDRAQLAQALQAAVARWQGDYPGLVVESHKDGWHIVIPPALLVGHEAHFCDVTECYLGYLAQGKLPRWETDFMLTKYFITTRALELARQR